MKNIIQKHTFSIFSLAIATLITVIAGREFLNQHIAFPLYPSKSLTRIEKLSKYNPNLKDTNGDTDIYYFEGTKPGGKTLILGGTHPNEPAAFLTTYLMLENINIDEGTIIIIPRANNSAFTHVDPQEGNPSHFQIKGKSGIRTFRFGSRITNPIDQWPDPDLYLHYPSGQKLAGPETRNLNRSFPGKIDGTMTERIAFAIVQLIKKEKIDLAFDLHEAAPEYPVVNAIVSSERSQDIASEATMELEFEGLNYSLEPSPYNFHGLSHREWQDFTDTYPLLFETANPIQGRLRGKTDVELLLTGADKMYLKATALGEVRVPYDSTGIPMRLRVGRHIAALIKVIEVFSNNYPERAVRFSNIPTYDEIMNLGIEHYF
ncbi:MAG: succinylglutamate desuccinylase/aspartoacylase family protein [Melioribacteraceae bacterium]|nr:succinylglutamate desuccinylase/aspartoacylase family protein [Melioribacteraceae bacterium]